VKLSCSPMDVSKRRRMKIGCWRKPVQERALDNLDSGAVVAYARDYIASIYERQSTTCNQTLR
jgi:hypothetical protein